MRSRQDLLTGVWGYHPDASSRTLDTHIKRLRDKFGELGGMIQTAYGVGYRLTPDPVKMPGNRFRSRR
jgi:two-component system, OmpR family, phosphate regulon response regulator PhoB